jgi:hypothetical protein
VARTDIQYLCVVQAGEVGDERSRFYALRFIEAQVVHKQGGDDIGL